MKRILALLLGIMIIFSSVNVMATEGTLEQKANNLNKLGVLKGDGRSYNLPGTLTRQEAATFIVRLLGAEKEVLTNKSQYMNITFKDVNPGKDWATPYIAYCVQKGIINGYTDNTFRPTAKLELQAFAKLLLVSLGYQYDKDFTWNNTLEKAKAVKLVTQEEINLAKSNPFTRGDVIVLLDRILTMKNLQTQKEMFYNLLKNDNVTESTLASVGFIRKVGNQVVEEVKEMSPGHYIIRFSTPPKSFSADNITLVDETGKNLKVKSMKVTDLLNVYAIDTDKPSENARYEIVIKNVLDRNNEYFKDYKAQFVALRKGGIESDLFRISQVKVLDKYSVEVEYTHPITEIMTNNNLYQIQKGNQRIAGGNDLKVTLTGNSKVRVKMINQSFESDQLYSLVVAGDAKSKLGVRINSGKDDSLRFLGKQIEAEKFDIVAIELLEKNKLRLTTNKPVSRKTAEQVFSYYLTDSSKREIKINRATLIENSEVDEQHIILDTNTSLITDRNYTLLVNQLYTEGRTEEIIEKEYSFTAGTASNGTYDLSSANQLDPYTIEFNFDTTMDQKTATIADNYYIRKKNGGSTIIPSSVYYDFDAGRMLLFLKQPLREIHGADYVLYAKTDIKGANGETRTNAAKVEFYVSDLEVQKVQFDRVVYIGDNSIQILYNEPIAKAVPNLDVYNYRVYDKATREDLFISGVRYIDGHRLVLIVENYNPKRTYELSVKKVLEYNNSMIVDDLPAIEIESGLIVQ